MNNQEPPNPPGPSASQVADSHAQTVPPTPMLEDYGVSRRKFLGVAGAGLLAASFGASKLSPALSSKLAATRANTIKAANKQTTLTFWNSFTASDKPFVEAIVAKYNSSQSAVHINMQIMPSDVLQQKLEISLGTGTGPDIPTAPGGPLQAIPQFANAGVIQPVDFVYGSGGVDKAVLPAGFFPAVTYTGHLYGVPMTIQPVALYYNTALLAKNKISPPKTVQELSEALIKISKTGISGMPLATTGVVDWWSLWIYAYGGNYDKAGKSLLTSPATVKAFEAWGNLEKNHHISPLNMTGAEGDSLFSTQQAAFDVSGPWVVPGFTAAKLPYDVMAFPAGPGGSHALGTGATMMLSSHCKELDAARNFFTFWTGKWAALEYAKSGSNALRTDIQSEVAKLGKFPARFGEMLPHIQYSLTGIVQFSEASAVITQAVEAVEAGESVPTVMSSLNGKFQQYLSAK